MVVNWNLADSTIRCVRALIDDGLNAERIVVVENGSNEESTAALQAALPDCRLLLLEENIGYGRACNRGARELPTDWYLFVNNDAFVHRAGSVRRLVERLRCERVGLAVPRLLNPDLSLQPSVVPLATPLTALLGATGLARAVPNRWQPFLGHRWTHDSSRAIHAANGAVFAVRDELWRELGGWTERELMFAEDSDLCRRAVRRGWRVWFEPDAEFVHVGSSSVHLRWGDAERAYLIGRSEGGLIRSELSTAQARLTLAFLRLGFALRIVYFELRGDRQAVASLRAAAAGYFRGR